MVFRHVCFIYSELTRVWGHVTSQRFSNMKKTRNQPQVASPVDPMRSKWCFGGSVDDGRGPFHPHPRVHPQVMQPYLADFVYLCGVLLGASELANT